MATVPYGASLLEQVHRAIRRRQEAACLPMWWIRVDIQFCPKAVLILLLSAVKQSAGWDCTV